MRIFQTALLLFSLSAMAAGTREGIYNTRTKQWLTLEQAALEMTADTIMVLGEQHVTKANQNESGIKLHHLNQLRWQKELNRRDFRALLGMEFLAYPYQGLVVDFLNGYVDKADFLTLVEWGSSPFDYYEAVMKESVLPGGGGTLALNIPKSVSSSVAKGGPSSLSISQRQLLPPIWEKGSAEYYERFKEAMQGHVSEAELENYFWAQSLWDDTMAWQATSNKYPNGTLTIVVGEFHAEFSHGLPARLKRFGATDVRTMIQIGVDRGADFDATVVPDPKYGERADYIWVFEKN